MVLCEIRVETLEYYLKAFFFIVKFIFTEVVYLFFELFDSMVFLEDLLLESDEFIFEFCFLFELTFS